MNDKINWHHPPLRSAYRGWLRDAIIADETIRIKALLKAIKNGYHGVTIHGEVDLCVRFFRVNNDFFHFFDCEEINRHLTFIEYHGEYFLGRFTDLDIRDDAELQNHFLTEISDAIDYDNHDDKQ